MSLYLKFLQSYVSCDLDLSPQNVTEIQNVSCLVGLSPFLVCSEVSAANVSAGQLTDK